MKKNRDGENGADSSFRFQKTMTLKVNGLRPMRWENLRLLEKPDDDQDWIRLDVRSMDKLSKGESQILASYRVWEDGMDTATLLALKSFTQAEGLLDDGSSLAKIEMSAQRYSRDYFNSGIWLKPEVVKELILGWREELSRETSYGRFFGWGFPDDFLGNDVSTRTDNFNYSPLLNTRFEPWQKSNGEQITLSVLPI